MRELTENRRLELEAGQRAMEEFLQRIAKSRPVDIQEREKQRDRNEYYRLKRARNRSIVDKDSPGKNNI